MKRLLFSLLAAGLVLISGTVRADDDFGFGDDTGSGSDTVSGGNGTSSGSSSFSLGPVGVKIGGKVQAELLAFTDTFETADKLKEGQLGDVFSGALNVAASGSAADAVINLNLAPVFDGAWTYQSASSPVTIDEAYVRAYFGPVNVEGGIRKLTWGKADSFGPLDVINPLDYTDLTKISDPMSVKIGRPLVHVSWGIGNFSKLEGMFVPWYQGHRFAMDAGDRWAPSQVTGLSGAKVSAQLRPAITEQAMRMLNLAQLMDLNNKMAGELDAYIAAAPTPQKLYSDSDPSKDRSLHYAQAGLRFTTTIASSDFGVQYYYGRLPRPALNIQVKPGLITPNDDGATVTVDTDKIKIGLDYNDYHQIGVDYAQVLFGFNVRAEFAANITEDLAGDRGDIYNPSLAWSLGFDRDVIAGINVNFQATESIRLFHDQIGKDPLVIDTEDGKDPTSTRLTLQLSRNFIRDKLQLKATGLWDIEEKGFLIMPSIAWVQNDVSVELSGGIFGGDDDGELGQYSDNHFIKAVLTYSF
ncbi:hypothetical protein AGMMS4952_11360 [Spirochaetia bacterium]|nr:hypothetical protein AGMMS4952_11360 [Spirochaetia bacterium]